MDDKRRKWDNGSEKPKVPSIMLKLISTPSCLVWLIIQKNCTNSSKKFFIAGFEFFTYIFGSNIIPKNYFNILNYHLLDWDVTVIGTNQSSKYINVLIINKTFIWMNKNGWIFCITFIRGYLIFWIYYFPESSSY